MREFMLRGSLLGLLLCACHAQPLAGPAGGGTIVTADYLPAECTAASAVCVLGNASSTLHALSPSSWTCDVPAALDAGVAAVTEWDATLRVLYFAFVARHVVLPIEHADQVPVAFPWPALGRAVFGATGDDQAEPVWQFQVRDVTDDGVQIRRRHVVDPGH